MEYYTKSEGLGFLIGESRIGFRIEFRGVSILCEFNSLIWLVSHDHHQTVRYGEVAGVSIAESTFSNSSVRKWPHDGATENLALRPGDVSTVKWCSKDEFVKWAKGVSNLVQVTESHSSDPVFYRQENSAFNSQSKMAWFPIWANTWLMSHDHRWLSSRSGMTDKKLRTVRHDPHKNCSGQSLVPTSKWYDTAETVSTMIRQTFETNIYTKPSQFQS